MIIKLKKIKNYSYSKKVIALLLCFVMCINSFAAIVNDDDSSAFVTKNEFDILKKDISNQISIYNKSINERIDGAINVYLSELNIDKKEELNNEYKNLNGKAKWMNLAWGSIFDGQANAYDSVKTYREPNFDLGDYLTGFAQYYYTAGENTVGRQLYYAPTSWKSYYAWGLSNFDSQVGSHFKGFDYIGVDERDNKMYLNNAFGMRVNQGVFITSAYTKSAATFNAFSKSSYSGEPGSLVWGDWSVVPSSSEDACISLYKLMYDRNEVDLKNAVPVCAIADAYNGVNGVSMSQNIAVQPVDYKQCYCYKANSWVSDEKWVNKDTGYMYFRWTGAWGSSSSWTYRPRYMNVLPWHKFATFNDIYVGPSINQSKNAKFGEGLIITEVVRSDGQVSLKLTVNVDESTAGSNVKCSAIRFYRGKDATGGYDSYDANTSLEYSVYTDENMKTKYESIIHTGETEDKYKKRIENNKTVFIKIEGENRIKKDDYIWIKVFPYSSLTEDTICCGTKNYVTLTIDDIYQKG